MCGGACALAGEAPVDREEMKAIAFDAYQYAYPLVSMDVTIGALAGLDCNLSEDAFYPNLPADADGKPLTGEHRYLLRFENGRLPPAQAFWSLTMYDDQGFQAPSPIDHFAIGDRDKLTFGVDGPLELYLQHEAPEGEKQSNWLPAPTGPFQVMMRIYSPTPLAVRKGLDLPVIQKLS